MEGSLEKIHIRHVKETNMAIASRTGAESTGVAKRFAYLDNIRSFVIFLVVALHTSVTYSGYGGWYYKETSPDRLDIASRSLFGLFEAFTQAWFMGILFFLSAFFATKSLAKRGPGAFVRERLFRLGLPLLVYMFVIEPFIACFIMDYGYMRESYGPGRFYLGYLSSFRWLGGTGPLWFAEALLLFSLPYAAWRALRPAIKAKAPAPTTLTIILIILVTGLLAFSIRLFQPVGTNVANLQLCYFGAYVVLFLLGIHAGERGWLEAYPEKRVSAGSPLSSRQGLWRWGSWHSPAERCAGAPSSAGDSTGRASSMPSGKPSSP